MKKSSAFDKVVGALRRDLAGRRDLIRDVAEPAQPFVAAQMADGHRGRVWVVCRDVRSQEDFAPEMAAWCDRVRIFPELETPAGDALPDPETASERIDLLRRIAAGDGNEVLVIHAGQWASPVPSGKGLVRDAVSVRRGLDLDPTDLVTKLVAAGYEGTSQVGARGQFARRGGILDVFSWQAARPLRIEWFDREIDSLREFDVDSQVSVGETEAAEILLGRASDANAVLRDYAGPRDLVIEIEPEASGVGVGISSEPGDSAMAFFPPPFGEMGAGDLVLDEAKRVRFFDQLREWSEAGWTMAFACANEGEGERFRELAADFEFDAGVLQFIPRPLTRGWFCPAVRLAVLSDAEVLGRAASHRAHRIALRRERYRTGRAAVDFSEFEEGDYVVHLEQGIGRYLGMQKEPGGEREVLALEFAHGARLYVPLDQAWQVARYVGLGKKHPDLSELGDGRWEKAKEKARQGIFEYAARMLKVQAERETGLGFAFPPDSRWQQEFERSFLFKETDDQLRAIAETKADMENERPMDRLICGDVGFGKTEVAIRAAFKAVTGGRQAAFIAPTTVLAQQHFQNLRERMSDYPVTIELLSRYRTTAEQKRVVKGLADGSVDIVVGTHRIISSDVHFKDLGLVIVDEEQRFGVKHKDALKEKFRQVDVLTLSATPIPRTLYLALMGARDMSLIETPPPNRQPVETIVCGYDERVIRDAIQRELARGGQVYFLHNRVQTIEKTALRIRELCEGARVIVGHGQMEERELEGVMQAFVGGKADVLVSTTIIESGLDIPNANTIIIDRADRFGLADLYQLRGRVGRSSHKAYAFLLLPRELMTVGAARRRVSAIKQYSELGSGFKIAMRDLEIRGAGNLLGTAQSGHIIAVGFDLYCKLLKRAVEAIRGRRTAAGSAILRVDFLRTDEAAFYGAGEGIAGAFLPAAYMPDPHLRIEAYRRLAEAGTREEIEALRGVWRDRFGPLPPAVENALVVAAIRWEATRRRITIVEVRDEKLMLTRGGSFILVGGRFPRLTAPDPDSSLREVLSLLEGMPLR
ncbi:MAG: transcription-repair coupling factor [Terrimicrobiaceae bacterium]|nr:transcription-repair coupling factor [Terrimicrobiaceae bacterium]